MLKIALFIGVYSYVILLLGLVGLLYPQPVLVISLFSIVALLWISRKNLLKLYKIKVRLELNQFEKFILILLVLLACVNLIGALGPELAFDSLWYHLTIPKIFAINHKVFFIQGNLFYYSLMPKLVEMLYTSTLILLNETGAKLIHFLFGVLTCVVLFRFCRIYLKRWQSLIVIVLFYSNLVVMWLSITAFSDLARAFFETFALFYFLIYAKKSKTKYLIISALLLGLAISTKVLAIGTLFIFILLILFLKKVSILEKLKRGVLYTVIALSVPLPWFVISFYYTKNPIYPLFSGLGLRNFTSELLSPIIFIKTFIGIFLFSPDPIGPVYIIFLPVMIFLFGKLFKKYSYIIIYVICSYLIWYFTAQSGGARFLTASLPTYSLLVVLTMYELKNKLFVMIGVLVIIITALTSIFYRGFANAKYIPVILGHESKQEFLLKNLNFSFGDFYDENNAVKNIVGNRTVLILNTHNLYYVDFPYTLDEWKSHVKYQYVLSQSSEIPLGIKSKPVYTNSRTHAVLYKL